MEKEKELALEKTLTAITKQFGVGSVQRLGDVPKDFPCLPTGIFPLDLAVGIGGLPRGRITEIYGPESAGKTLITLQLIAETQKNGGLCAFIDAEHALSLSFAKNVGVNVDELLVSQPDCGEDALEIAEQLIRSGCIDLIIIDSVAALTPKAEIEGNMGDSNIGLQARLMSQALRKLVGVVSSTNTALVFINQLREKVGVMYGNPEVTTGGRALKFYSSLRLDVRKIQQIKDGADAIGNRIKVKVVKNKVATPFKEAEFDLIFSKGVDNDGCIVDAAVKLGIIEKSGAWFSYGTLMRCQGREKTIVFLQENPEVRQEIASRVKEAKII